MLALVAMLSSFTFSAYAQQVITVSNAAELREALTGNDGIQQSASLQRGARAAVKLTIELDAYTDPSQVQEIIEAGYDVTLNLNGCTLIGDFTNKGSLTIVDETGKGAIIGSITNEEGATLTLESGNIIAQGGAAIVNKGTANFNGGSVTGEMTNTGTLNGEPTAATIGDAATLQAAINAAVDGQVITLAADITGNVTVVQKPNVKITIDGAGKNFTGSITVDGKSAAYPTAGVTIQNVNFVDVATDAVCINLGVSGNNNTRYTSNVTVQNCTFTGTDKTAAAIKSYTGGDKQLAIIGCTATGMHSLVQLKNVAGVEVTGCKVIDGKNGISLGVSSDVAISQTEMDCTGYGVRADANAAGGSATITDSKISAMIPVVVRNATTAYDLTFDGANTIEASNGDGIWCAVGIEEYGDVKDDDTVITLENIGDATGKVLVTLEDEGLSSAGVYGYNLAGEGTEASPYLIGRLADLEHFRAQVNGGNSYKSKVVKLTADIDLNNEEWTPIGTSEKPFNGVFDGNGKTVSNLIINAEGKSNIGFFGRTNSGEIKNLTISNAKVTGRLAVGVVAGCPYTSKYTNIKVTGHVEVNGMAYVGGVGGRNAYADWTDITVDVDADSYVKANSVENGTAYRTYVGGVIGFNGEGDHTFKNISSNIKVIGSTQDIGGIFGILHYSNNAENITFTGAVEAPADAEEVGAIAGVWHNQHGTDVEINNITSTGSVTVGGEVIEGSIVGGAYNASNETPETSGSLKIDGEEAWIAVAKIGETKYQTLADAVKAVKEGETITILAREFTEGSIILPSELKNVTFKGVEGAILKDMTISAADGNSYSYVGLTFDGITFDNSRILITGWRNGDPIVENLTVTNCTFKNLNDNTNEAPVHINMDATEAVNGFTFTNNVIDGIAGGSKSGVYAQLTGEVVFTDNVINNVSFRPYVIQLTTDDGIADKFTVTGNTFSGSAAGRAQALGNNAEGTDAVELVVSNNIFTGITNAQQICYWNFNAETTTADLSKNYYDIDILANPGKFYFNGSATDAGDLIDFGVYPYYTELNEDGTINVESLTVAPMVVVGTTGYQSLAEAFANVQDGETVTLYADLALAESVVNTKTVTFDLNGKTITGTDNNESGNFYLINNSKGNLTIVDGSEDKTGKITLVATTERNWSASSVVVANNLGTVTVKSGTIEHLGGTAMAYALDNLTNGDNTVATLNIEGGNIASTYRAVRQFANKGTNNLNITGGDIASVWMQSPNALANVVNIDITGGTVGTLRFTGANAVVTLDAKADCVGEIIGTMPAGLALTQHDGYYSFDSSAATINGVAYASLKEALAAVKDGETIVLAAECAENVTITQKAGLSFTIDGAGNTYTGIITVKGNGKQSQVNDHSLTISNVNFVVAANTNSITTSNYAHNITVDGCSFTGSGSGYGMKIPQSYNVTVKNTTGTKLFELVYSNKAVNKFTAENVTVKESSHGFYMSYGVNMSFKNLNLNVTGAGVYTNNYNSSTAAFEDCTITAQWGVYLEQKNTTKAYTLTFNGTNSFNTTGDWLSVNGTDATFKVVLNDENLNADNIPNLVAKAGNVYSNKFLTTFEAAQDGDTVTLLADVAMDTKKYTTQDDGYAVLLNVKGKAVTLDLNGKKLTVNAAAADLANAKGTMLLGVFSADLDGNFTITDSSEEAAGAVEVIANDAKIYSVFVSESAQSDKSHSGKLVVNNGSFTTVGAVDNAMFFSDADEVITINGGNFHLDGMSTNVKDYPWLINTYDNNKCNVIVTGGTFNADINHQYRPFEVKIAETLALQNNGNGTWTIVPAEAYVTEMLGGTVDEAGNNEHKVGYATFEEAIAAVNELGKTVTLLNDVVIDKSIYVTGKNLTLDGAGHTFTQAEGLTFGNYLVPLRFNSGEYTIKNVVFDGWTSKSVLRIENATAELDNVTIQNTNWNTETQAKSYGVLYVENSDITVKNSKFLNNVSGSTVTYGYGSSNDMATQLHIDNCLFENNVSNGDCSIIYYVKGSGCTITNSEFIGNKVNCNTNGATVYLGFMENCSVTGNLFKDNQVVDASTSTRVAGAVFFGYDAEITGNAFDNNTAANANDDVLGQVCTSLYYTDIDLSGNYWGEVAPEYGTAYTIQHQTTADRSFVLASYYTAYELDADGNLVLGDEDTFDWTFVDGEFSAYTNKYDMEVGVLTYKRNNIPTTWTPFYVPFEVPVSQLADKFEVAYINGVRRNDTDLDGELDVFEMEVIYIHGGNADGSAKTLKANYPYFIRSKNGVRENLEITLEDITLYAAKDATYDCTTMTEKFEITGNSSAITLNSSDALRYGVSGGKWSQIINDQVLKPFRFYMTVSSRDNSEVVVPMSTMSIAVRGEEREDGTTLIYDVEYDAQSVDYIYDLQGRRVLEPQKGGLYIINGKKVIF